jgi:hypothetical protein
MTNNPLQRINMLPVTCLHSWDLQIVTQILKRSWQKDWGVWTFMQVLILIHTLMLSHPLVLSGPLVLSHPLALSLALIHIHIHDFHVQDHIANHPSPVLVQRLEVVLEMFGSFSKRSRDDMSVYYASRFPHITLWYTE